MSALEEMKEHANTLPTEEAEKRFEAIRAREVAARRLLNTQDISGGVELMDFADTVIQDVAEAWDNAEGNFDAVEERFFEIADGAVPAYTWQRVECVAESVDLATREPEQGTGTTVADIAGAVLYDLAYQLAYAEAERLRDEAEEESEED